MNKYQEALKNIEIIKDFIDTQRREAMLGRIKNFSSKYLVKTFQEIHNVYYDIKELVDKETPKKLDMMRIKKYDGYDIGICQCGKTIERSLDDDIKYCPKCGQAIDWSDEK